MTEKDAIKIIDEIRCSNSFTMGLSIDEYIESFSKRYAKMTGIIIPHNVIAVAKIIKTLNN